MSDTTLKQIENHIKDLLFNNKDPTTVPEAPKTVAPNLNYSRPNAFQPFGGSKSFLLTGPEDNKLLGPPLGPLDCNLNEQQQSSSQLIDVNVLTNFAAKHADSKMLTEPPAFLPHPELENDLPVIGSKDPLLPASVNNGPSAFPSFSEKALGGGKDYKNRGRNSSALEDSTKEASERHSDKGKRRARKNRKQAKERTNQKIRGEVEVQAPPPSKDSPRRKNIKNASPQKKAASSEERRAEYLPPKNESDSLHPRAPLPAEETEYVYSMVKDGFKFYCHICNYESRSKDYIIKHLNSDNHKDLKKQIQADRVLPFLPPPLGCQWEILEDLLARIHSEHGLSSQDLALREAFFARFNKFIQDNIPGCSLEMIGSSATGLGLKKSKVDMALKVEETQNIPDSLELVYKTLLSDPSFCEVESDFKKKKVGIRFRDVESGLPCYLVLENMMSEKFARMFSFYSELDPRVKVLASCFRHWAELCSLDNQDYGTLPSVSFPIMLVHFLQQIEPPVLPVLNELKEYGNVDFAEKYVKGKAWKSENNCSVAELWLKLFHFYNFTYELGKHVICVRSSEKVLCSERNWSTKFYAIEDPFSKRNIAHVIPNFSVAHYIQQCFLRTFRYFAFPQLASGGEVKLVKDEEFEGFLLTYSSSKAAARDESLEESEAPSDNEDSSLPDESILDLEDHDPDLPIENAMETIKRMILDDPPGLSDEEVADDEDSQEGGVKVASAPPQNKAESSPKKESKKSKPEERVVVRGNIWWDLGGVQVTKESLKYCFDPVIFKGGTKNVPYSCKLCKSSGHLKKNCPSEDRLPRPVLPEMTIDFLRLINKTLCYIRDKNCVDEADKLFMQNNMREIEKYIRKEFPDANLSMFGSFCNGFGFKSRSDMDFCLTFTDVADSKELDSADIIKKLGNHLQQYPRLENIVPVTSAKVPIVKFACRESRLEGDISLYNTLAIANTEMLELYSKLDPRVQVLGFALKYFAKVLGICDASRGSLSSYAYILMVIYYLQQRQPHPVIPVLQELHGAEKPTDMIDGWNVWYFKDVDKLPEVWPEYGKNTDSPAELWLGLLSFYAFDFDWREHVVCIRQRAPLTKFRKLWITDQIAIEDPFDLNHNLGAGLSRKMNMYIFRAFARGLERFGTPLPPDKIHTIIGHEVVYLFDRRFLNSGSEPPHDRGCRSCGKIGHIAKNCTQEKLCLFCRKSGHKAKDCPRKKQQKGKSKQERNNHENFPYENNKGGMEPQNSMRHSNAGDMPQRTHNNLPNHMPNKSNDENRKLLQMGYPAHRHPPPGFAKSYKGPPPGFMSRFPHPEPFPRQRPPPEVAQSPPKHFSSSPPKNFNMFHKDSPPPMGFRTGGLLPDPHMMGAPGRMWPLGPPQRMAPPPYMDHRWKRGS